MSGEVEAQTKYGRKCEKCLHQDCCEKCSDESSSLLCWECLIKTLFEGADSESFSPDLCIHVSKFDICLHKESEIDRECTPCSKPFLINEELRCQSLCGNKYILKVMLPSNIGESEDEFLC